MQQEELKELLQEMSLKEKVDQMLQIIFRVERLPAGR